MAELTIEAKTENLDKVLAFVDELLERTDCPMRTQMQIEVAVEEIFTNIASYAYAPGTGTATIRAELREEPPAVKLTFFDCGMAYDPLTREDPDVTLAAEDRPVGGLGVFMVKKTMDDVSYEYKDGKNVLRMKKHF